MMGTSETECLRNRANDDGGFSLSVDPPKRNLRSITIMCGCIRAFTLTVAIALSGTGCRHSTQMPTSSNLPISSEPDTTSHAISWIVDSLGPYGSIRDVWAFSRDSAIAVGQIVLPDSDGQITGANLYTVALWTGGKWHLQKLTYPYQGQNAILVEARGIWVSPSGICWLCASSVWSWDGSSAQAQLRFDDYTQLSQNPYQSVEKLWGAADFSIFGVGSGGTIIHYDGTSWAKMASGTTVDLQDVWGLDGTHVWATGYNVGDGHSVLLQYNGTSWTTLYDNISQPPLNYFHFSTVWTYDPSILYLSGGSQLRILKQGTYTQIETGGQWITYRTRGSGVNDIFTTGQGSELTHYNGVSWYLYPELKALNGGDAWFYSISMQHDFVLVGGLCLTTYNGRPIVIRGYR